MKLKKVKMTEGVMLLREEVQKKNESANEIHDI